jgi:UDP-glucose-4-epimerase GalE
VRILVTGGAGYVGSFATRHLMRSGHQVVVIDNLCQGHRGTLPEDVLVVGDIADRELLGRLLREHRIEAVMHFAAATSVAESVERPEYHWRNNTVNTLGLLETMLEHDVRKIVFSSTAATYGSTGEMPLVEDAPKNPVCPYGFSKLAIEWMIQDLSLAHGLGYVILRYFTASGAAPDGSHGEDHTPETHLIPLILQAVQGKRKQVEIYGDDWDTRDGTCLRDYVHVDDLALAHELAVTQCPEPGATPSGHIMNVGTGSGNTVMEVMQAVEAVTGKKVPYRMAGRRPGDPARLLASSDRLRGVLGWKPSYTEIAQVVETAWKWHGSHPEGYSS